MVSGIDVLIAQYVAASTGMQFAAKKALWDADEPMPVLQPEELAEPLLGWPAIERYWSASRDSMLELRSQHRDLLSWQLSGRIAVASYTLRWRATMQDSLLSQPLAADNRATMLLRLKPEGWRIFHYAESVLSLQTVAQRLAERAALGC